MKGKNSIEKKIGKRIEKFFVDLLMLVILIIMPHVGFTQNFDSKWIVKYDIDDFGDYTGECAIKTVVSEKTTMSEEDKMEGELIIYKDAQLGICMLIVSEYFNEELTDRDAVLSFKTEDNKVIETENGLYVSDKQCAAFIMTNEIISLFKNSSKLKIALKVLECKPLALEMSCIGFTKAYNEFLNCK